MYDVKSARAEDFINDEEILDTLNYSAKHKSDASLIKSILEKAALCQNNRSFFRTFKHTNCFFHNITHNYPLRSLDK